MFKLDVISDPICPWCYIGKTHLDRALAERPDHGFVIKWHPFQLNPTMPPEGMDRRAYLETKFGGPEGAKRAYAPVVQAAAKAGLSINFDGIKTTPNTIDAHRLIHWAGQKGCQTEVVDRLFEAYFVAGKNIGDHAILADIAEAIFDGDWPELGTDLYAVGMALAAAEVRRRYAAQHLRDVEEDLSSPDPDVDDLSRRVEALMADVGVDKRREGLRLLASFKRTTSQARAERHRLALRYRDCP